MYLNNPNHKKVGKTGRLVLPPKPASRHPSKPSGRECAVGSQSSLRAQPPSQLTKIYIEPTNQCNLECRMCVRNVWNEPQGKMSEEVFSRVMEGLRSFSLAPTIFFGGFGEPLSHPKIIEMVRQAKSLGTSVELITNATLLTKEKSLALIEAGLDMLWVSLDGAKPESFADIRLGATLPKVLENLAQFHKVICETGIPKDCFIAPRTQLGIVFVAMKRNIADLPAVIDIGLQFGAKQFLMTNVLPYTKDMIDETLYNQTVSNDSSSMSMNLPRMDVNEATYTPIIQAVSKLNGTWPSSISENKINRCPFIANGAGAIRWDGNLSPCLPLLHNQVSYRSHSSDCSERFSRPWAIGNVMERSLSDLWNTPEHLAFRKRVQAWDFSPCLGCAGCGMQSENEEDCYSNVFPTCGNCLWAQGVIQCP